MKMADNANARILFQGGSALILKHCRNIERAFKRETGVKNYCNGFGGD
jgi:hypothetical protein